VIAHFFLDNLVSYGTVALKGPMGRATEVPMRSHLAAAVVFVVFAAPAAVLAQDSVQNGSNAVRASAEAVGGLGLSGVQTALAVSVVPVSVAAGGSVVAGASLTETGGGSSVAARDSAAFASTPLPVTKRVIVAQPAPAVPYDAQLAKKP
jgi:hypothetical protein